MAEKNYDFERYKEYYEKNRDRIIEYNTQYRMQNKKEYKNYQREYYLRNRRKFIQKAKQRQRDKKNDIEQMRRKNKLSDTQKKNIELDLKIYFD